MRGVAVVTGKGLTKLTIIDILLRLTLTLQIGLLLTVLLNILKSLPIGVLLRDGRYVLALRNDINIFLTVTELIAIITYKRLSLLLVIPDIGYTLTMLVGVFLTVQGYILHSLGVCVLLRDKRLVSPFLDRIQHHRSMLIGQTVVLGERLNHLDIIINGLGVLSYHILLDNITVL